MNSLVNFVANPKLIWLRQVAQTKQLAICLAAVAPNAVTHRMDVTLKVRIRQKDAEFREQPRSKLMVTDLWVLFKEPIQEQHDLRGDA